MKRLTIKQRAKLALSRETIRQLGRSDLSWAAGGFEVASGSQQETGSVTCPPPKNGEGSGCVTG